MRVKFRGYQVVITRVTTGAGTHWYSAVYSEEDDGDRSLPPCDTYLEAMSQAKSVVASYLGIGEVVRR